MKKLLLILLCLPLLFKYCQDSNPSHNNSNSNLDSYLFGTWCFEGNYEYIVFNSNPNFECWSHFAVGEILEDTII
jgi:hypothetical protein